MAIERMGARIHAVRTVMVDLPKLVFGSAINFHSPNLAEIHSCSFDIISGTQKSFNNFYYRHYEKIYKTTLYDF